MTVAIIQARMSSSRLYGKVLLPLGDKTVLDFVYDQTCRATTIDSVVIATSDTHADDSIEQHCQSRGMPVFRGSHTDVLERYYLCAKNYSATTVVRITADCPLIDPAVIDTVVKSYQNSNYDYVSNSRPVHTFPNGIELEVFSFAALERAYNSATKPSEREHVTSFIWNNPDLFSLFSVTNSEDLSHLRVTLDESEDYQLITHIVDEVGESHLTLDTIQRFLAENPQVTALNRHIQRDEGYFRSLQEEAE